MNHPDRTKAKRFDSWLRDGDFTDKVYHMECGSVKEGWGQLLKTMVKYAPEKNRYQLYCGDLHGHTNLSDGIVDIDTFFTNLRDLAKADFCALSDHDHGGVGNPPIWGIDKASGKQKWALIKEKTDAYYEPGRFTTIPAYERDSYPWFSNMVIYFRSTDQAELFRGERDGELTEAELQELSTRDDVLYGPHTCAQIDPGSDLFGRTPEQMPRTFEIYSRAGAYEYYDNPFQPPTCVRGCGYIDALEAGAKVACIACSDDHKGFNGRDAEGEKYGYTGMTGVYAEENTREAIFDAIKARRCYAYMGEKRVGIDFRINSHYMGEEFVNGDDKRTIFFKIDGETPVDRVDLIKNGRSVVFFRNQPHYLFFDYQPEREEDYYYLRVRLQDGRYAWTSPIWVRETPNRSEQ